MTELNTRRATIPVDKTVTLRDRRSSQPAMKAFECRSLTSFASVLRLASIPKACK